MRNLQRNAKYAAQHSGQARYLAGTAAIATLGAASLWYLGRRTRVPINTSEIGVATAQSAPHPIPAEATYGDAPLQLLSSGAGPLYVRAYEVDVSQPRMTREALLNTIIEDLNHYTPQELAHFEKTKGAPDKMVVGDEYFIHILGPWNGPVRTIEVTPDSFTFATLQGHLESGQVSFSVLDHPERKDALRFRIQSWARSSNWLTDFFYRILGFSRFAQTTMWTLFCQKVAEVSGGEMLGKIEVMTHHVNANAILRELPAWKRYTPQFERWRQANLNFDINKTEQITEANGWRIDDYAIGLPGEAPGEPVANGPFEAAKQVVLNYEFPDPSLISGVFVPDDPLKDRIMILRAHFLIFSFLFGVRIGNVIDEVRQTEKQGAARVWGYSYRTLQGHFEMGEITFELWKYLETGTVQFRIHAYSKPDRIGNPFYRLGFWLFGRSLQVRFARTALSRMQQIVLERLPSAERSTETVDKPEVMSLEGNAAAQQKAAAV